MRFRFLTGDVNWRDYGGKWVSKKLNNGEFDYWLIIEFTNMEEACGRDHDPREKYHVQINAVAPELLSAENKLKAIEGYGIPSHEVTDLMWVEAIDSYGIHSVLWQHAGTNAYKLLHEARREAWKCEALFGFYMDGSQNKIGTTGWEAIRGDLYSSLARTIASGSVTGRILGKMHGLTDDDLAAYAAQPGSSEDGGGSRISPGENAPGDGRA